MLLQDKRDVIIWECREAFIDDTDSVAVFSSFFYWWAPKDADFVQQGAMISLMAIQGHPRSLILVPINSNATAY